MKISTKSRYGLAAITYIAQNSKNGEFITVANISETLGFSKIYLEQTFSFLKRAGIVAGVKGAQGGYKLAREPKDITVFDILCAIETQLFDDTEKTVERKDRALEIAMQTKVFQPISNSLKSLLVQITIEDLVIEAEKNRTGTEYMYFI